MDETAPGSRVFILAGGEGTRIRPVLGHIPKALAPIGGKAFIDHLVAQASAAGFREVILLIGVGATAIREHFRSAATEVAVRFSEETELRGTAGAIRLAAERFPADRYLILNGDSYADVALDEVMDWHLGQGAACTIVVTAMADAARFGTVELDADLVTGFTEKSTTHAQGLINAGVYVMENAAVQTIPSDRPVSLEHEILPALAGSDLRAYVFQGSFFDIGVPEAYAAVLADPPFFRAR